MNISELSNIQWLQSLVDLANKGVVLALLFSFIFGTASIIFSKKLNKAKDEFHVAEKLISDQKISEANENAAKSNERASRISLQLEKEKIKRLELEEAVSPRILEQYNFSNAMKQYNTMKAIISHIPNIEAQRTAGQIAVALNMAGWSIKFTHYNPKEIYQDGVVIDINAGIIIEDDISKEAARKLIEQLKINKVESKTMPTSGLGKNTLSIKVGFKPHTYFSEKKIEKINNTSEQGVAH